MRRGIPFQICRLRLHPAASRVHMLAKKQPATFVIFDILETDRRQDIMSSPFLNAASILEKFYQRYCSQEQGIKLSPADGVPD